MSAMLMNNRVAKIKKKLVKTIFCLFFKLKKIFDFIVFYLNIFWRMYLLMPVKEIPCYCKIYYHM